MLSYLFLVCEAFWLLDRTTFTFTLLIVLIQFLDFVLPQHDQSAIFLANLLRDIAKLEFQGPIITIGQLLKNLAPRCRSLLIN